MSGPQHYSGLSIFSKVVMVKQACQQLCVPVCVPAGGGWGGIKKRHAFDMKNDIKGLFHWYWELTGHLSNLACTLRTAKTGDET